MKTFWDQRYKEEEYIYGTDPNSFFRSIIDTLAVGKLLLPAEGEGRNAVYAAQKGWEVVAFDFSQKGYEKAQRLASEKGVTIDYQVCGFAEFDFKANEFDAVGLFYAHQAPQNRQLLHQSCVKALKAGGSIILEAFSPKQMPLKSGGPKKLDMLYSEAMLAKDFENLKDSNIQELQTQLAEGAYHTGLAEVIRLVGKK